MDIEKIENEFLKEFNDIILSLNLNINDKNIGRPVIHILQEQKIEAKRNYNKKYYNKIKNNKNNDDYTFSHSKINIIR